MGTKVQYWRKTGTRFDVRDLSVVSVVVLVHVPVVVVRLFLFLLSDLFHLKEPV